MEILVITVGLRNLECSFPISDSLLFPNFILSDVDVRKNARVSAVVFEKKRNVPNFVIVQRTVKILKIRR